MRHIGKKSMNIFDIKQSLVQPITKLTDSEWGRPNFGKPNYQAYSREPGCGTINMGNLQTVLGSSNQRLDSAIAPMANAARMSSVAIDAGYQCLGNCAQLADKATALGGRLTELGVTADKYSKIDLNKPDLNIGLSFPDANEIQKRIIDMDNCATGLIDASGKCLGSYEAGGLGDDTYEDGEVVVPLEEPINSLNKALICTQPNILGMLAAGIGRLSDFTGLSNSPVRGAIDSIQKGLVGFGQALGWGQSQLQSGMNGFGSGMNLGTGSFNTNNLSSMAGDLFNAGSRIPFASGGGVGGMLDRVTGTSIGGVSTKLFDFFGGGGGLQNLASARGVGYLMGVAFGQQAASGRVRGYEACQSAMRMNRYGTFDPFLEGVFSTNSSLARMAGLNSSRQASSPSTRYCRCCVQRDRYERESSYYDLGTSNYEWYSRQPSSYGKSAVDQYGNDPDSVLETTLAYNLETYRVGRETRDNITELRQDFSKFPEFNTNLQCNMSYVKELQSLSIEGNMAEREALYDKIAEISV
jgi:hypothetical protein